MKRPAGSAIILIMAIFFTALVYCDDYYDGPPLKTIDGKVVSVDTLSSKITINSVNDITFYVLISTVIKQDVFDIRLSDLKAGDYVTVDYRDDESGRHNAEAITKHYSEGEGV